MAKLQILAGSTSQTINVFIQDSSSTTGAGLTGLAFNSAGLTAYYALPRAAPVQITLATQTVTGAYSSGGFVELDATNMPGWYRFDLPDAALASGRFSDVHLKGATNMAPLPLEIELTAVNNQSNTAFVASVPAVVGAVGSVTGNVGGNVTGSVGSVVGNVGGNVTGSVGSVVGAVGSVTGNVGGNVVGTVASVVGNVGGNVVGNVNGNVVGSVGSVSGAVGSVTGNVGGNLVGNVNGNVVGSVGSVAGAVGSVTGNVGGNVVGSVGSVVAGVTVSTNNDKTGYTLLAGTLFIKKNVGITITFPMTDSVTHSPATGLAVSAQRSIDGGAIAFCANAVTEIGQGLYSIVLAATDTNGTQITYIFSAVGADTKFLMVVTQT